MIRCCRSGGEIECLSFAEKLTRFKAGSRMGSVLGAMIKNIGH